MHELHRWTGDEPSFPPPPPLLYHVVYCSRATGVMDEAAVQRILATAHRFNAAHGITGMLVLGGGVFFQWLEGPREHITALMERLRADPRHEHVVELTEEEEARERLFPQWDMELVSNDQVREVLEDALASTHDQANARSLRQLLQQLDQGPLARLRNT